MSDDEIRFPDFESGAMDQEGNDSASGKLAGLLIMHTSVPSIDKEMNKGASAAMKIILQKISACMLILILCVGPTIHCFASEQILVEAKDSSNAEAKTENLAKVLYISAYGYDWSSVPYQIEGVSSVLSKEAEIEYLFMNTKKIPYDYAKEDTCADVKELYDVNGTYDLIIAEDDAALDFVLEYRTRLFEGIPIVFMGVNTAEKANLAHEDPLITGMVEFFPYYETISLASRMYPKATKIVGISDNSDSGQGCLKRFFDEEASFPQLEFIEMNASNLSQTELAKQLSELDDSTILIFLALINDGDGNIYSLEAATRFVNEHAKIPMFKADMNGIGMGVLGGYVSSYEDMGKIAATQALEILHGTSPADIPVDTMGGYPLFDYNIMEQFNISQRILPKDSIILNQDISFFELYRTQLLIFAIIISVLIIVIVGYFAVSRQRNNNRLKIAVEDAQAATKEKTAFLARMSHDMRTPMNTIINLTRMVEEELNQPDNAMADLKHIETSNQFLLGLIEDILDVSRIESGKLTLHPERYSYPEFLSYMNFSFMPLAKERNIELTIAPGTEYVDIMIDKVRFNQVCFNLVSNALKYTEPGGHVKLLMEPGKVKNGLLPCTITVSDDGIGMSKEFQENMFQAFTQEGRSYKTVEGAGLGLSIVKSILDCMGGTISVQSELGKGSVFTVNLNMVLAPEEEGHQDEAFDFIILQGKHILLAEDHPMNQKIAKRLLENKKMTVKIVNNGQQAVDTFLNHPKDFDAILMDLRMPVMDGLSAAKAIRLLNIPEAKTIPIIAMTANTFESDIEECLNAGMNAHIAKPIEPSVMYATLYKYVKNHSF